MSKLPHIVIKLYNVIIYGADANKRVDCFSDQVFSKLQNLIPKRSEMLRIMQNQGFNLNL